MKGSVLVTGGGQRIGAAICAALRARGWRVLVHSRAADGPLRADFAEAGAAERLFAAAVRAAPDLAALVNNAAVFATAAALPPVDAARLMRVNADAPARLTALLAAHLAARGAEGAVVNLLDARILGAPPARPPTPYEASKRALLRATVADARRHAPTLRVNAVAPGPVLAPASAADREKGGAVLLARRPAPADVARAVAFLLEAPGVTGQTLAVDSGQSLCGIMPGEERRPGREVGRL